MRRIFVIFFTLLFTSTLVACGGGSSPPPPQREKTVRVCSGLTDKCQVVKLSTLQKATRPTLPNGGCAIVDVSDYQGYINWDNVKTYVCGGVTKGGEGGGFGGGSEFVHNWTSMRSLGIWHSMYWFLRGSAGCSTQAALIVQRLQSVDYAHDPTAGNVDLDKEVPDANANNEVACITNEIWNVFHRHADVYTAPGTNYDNYQGPDPLWQAEYGPVLHPIYEPVVAWQCTDGVYGCVHYIGGIGYDDVSVDMGMTNERGGPPPPPPDPYAYFFNTNLKLHGRIVNEKLAIIRWDQNGCENPVRRAICGDLRYDLEISLQRIYAVVFSASKNHPASKDWLYARRGRRAFEIRQRINTCCRKFSSQDV